MSQSEMPSQSEVEAAVVAAIAQSLYMEPEQISMHASLEAEYGAESLDMLEIVFILEREFAIRLPKTTLWRHAEEHFGVGKLDRQGELTELGLNVLRQMRPEIDAGEFRKGLRTQDLGRLLTGQTFVRLVMRMLDGKREAYAQLVAEGCPQCGSHDVDDPARTRELVCAECGMHRATPNGDALLVQDLANLEIENRP
jgi:acyl carrier protein